ncbi:MAG: 50S ribosomal protein L9 [Treponema sp.]|jgi:large subunit ribosomal protein L9|nr:50S ribosomal protein L9 [Treponema sp.]
MKVILNKDLSPLGEEGDVKDVAKGYFRNYLYPRGIAVPYNEETVRIFESRKDEIEARKVEKRKDAAGFREKLEALELSLTMPAGPNGKLYGAVTAQTVAEELSKQGYPTERKRVELPGNSFKSVGKYKITVKLYEGAAAEITLTVLAQEIKTETKPAATVRRGKLRPAVAEEVAVQESVPSETPITESPAMESSVEEPVPVDIETPVAETPAE